MNELELDILKGVIKQLHFEVQHGSYRGAKLDYILFLQNEFRDILLNDSIDKVLHKLNNPAKIELNLDDSNTEL